MLIIGCDYHLAFQQIAFVDTETGELQERRLEHPDGAEKFYRSRCRRRVPEVSGSPQPCHQLPTGCAGASRPRTRLCPIRRHRQSEDRLSGFPHALERRRPRHSHPEGSQSRVREAAMKRFDPGTSVMGGQLGGSHLPDVRIQI